MLHDTVADAIYHAIYVGLQPVVEQSTLGPSGSRALRSQTRLRKINARSCVDLYSYKTNRRYFMRRFREAMSGFANLLIEKSKKWNVSLLVGAQHMLAKHYID